MKEKLSFRQQEPTNSVKNCEYQNMCSRYRNCLALPGRDLKFFWFFSVIVNFNIYTGYDFSLRVPSFLKMDTSKQSWTDVTAKLAIKYEEMNHTSSAVNLPRTALFHSAGVNLHWSKFYLIRVKMWGNKKNDIFCLSVHVRWSFSQKWKLLRKCPSDQICNQSWF